MTKAFRPCRELHSVDEGFAEGCPGCVVYRTRPGFATLWGPEEKTPKAECIHLGEPTGELVECPTCSGRTVKLKLRICAVHVRCTEAKQVEGVACCVGCREKSLSVVVPQPPALDLSPQSRTALVTVVVGPKATAMHEVTGPYMRHYARRLGIDYVVLDWPGHSSWPLSSKFGIARTLDHYERIAYVDADVLLRPDCLNLFNQCHPWEVGVVDELPWHRSMPQHKREPQYQAFRKAMGFADVPLPWYFNAGVMVIPQSAKELFLPPVGPIPVAHCAEQDHSNAKLLESDHPYRLLDRRCNWQRWTDSGFVAAPPEAVLHFSGGHWDRAKEIARWIENYENAAVPASRQSVASR